MQSKKTVWLDDRLPEAINHKLISLLHEMGNQAVTVTDRFIMSGTALRAV